MDKKKFRFGDLFPQKGDSGGEVARKIVFIASVLLVAVCAGGLVFYYFFRDMSIDEYAKQWSDYKISSGGNDKRSTISVKLNGGGGSAAARQVSVLDEYAPLYAQNSDFVGWLEISDDEKVWVTYPVTQTSDNEYYLHHDFNKKKTENGTVFADYESKLTPDTRSANVILYGHNLRTKNLFQPLLNYRDDFSFLKQHPLVKFDTLFERGQYKIFACFLTNTKPEHGEVFEYWNYTDFTNAEEFYRYTTECLDRSYYYTGVDVRYGDELLTLSTCDFSMEELRFVVVARKVRDGEGTVFDLSKFIDNRGKDENGYMKRKLFDAYYKLMNGGKGWGGRKWNPDYMPRNAVVMP